MPKVLSSKDSEFRNKVIHDGKIPTRDEAIKWAENIQEMILFISEEFLDKTPELFAEVQSKDLIKRYQEAQKEWPGARIGTMGFGTALSFCKNPEDKMSIGKSLEAIKRRREN